MTVINNGYSSAAVPVSIATIQPAIFSMDSSGSGQGESTLPEQSLSPRPPGTTRVQRMRANSSRSIAMRSGRCAERTENRRHQDGSAAPAGTTLYTVNQVTVAFGGVHEPAQFAGLAPSFAGVYQVNAQIPAGLSGDAVPVTITVADPQTGQILQSNTVTMSIQ